MGTKARTRYWPLALVAFLPCSPGLSAADSTAVLVFNCSADNDLYRVVTACGGQCSRYDTATEAVDLGKPTAIRKLGAEFLQSVDVGVFLPPQMVLAVSDDGRAFRDVARVEHDVSLREEGPLVRLLSAGQLDVRARYVRVRAAARAAGQSGLGTVLSPVPSGKGRPTSLPG